MTWETQCPIFKFEFNKIGLLVNSLLNHTMGTILMLGTNLCFSVCYKLNDRENWCIDKLPRLES